MNHIEGKKILLALTGSIAAYKAAILVRLLVKKGAEVKVVMTEAAGNFITPLTLSTLSKHPVEQDLSDGTSWTNHVELGLWADAMVVAPLTATTLGKMAHGISDNLVVACYLSAKCPVFFAPAMDLDMWLHPSTQSNVKKLVSYGNHLIPVEHGELASGLIGDGRMAEPETILDVLSVFFGKKKDLIEKKVMITAGPTQESIDPVRFISNHSSGKMGIAIARECQSRGADVCLILGPTKIDVTGLGEIISVRSAEQMYNEARQRFSEMDVTVLAAAVADYTPITTADQKIKKKEGDMKIDLKRTTDIAAELGKIKKKDQKLIGFALETQNEIENAKSKLKRKNFDFIVLNSLNNKGSGFQVDTNKIDIIHQDGKINNYPLKSKTKVAIDIVNEIVEL